MVLRYTEELKAMLELLDPEIPMHIYTCRYECIHHLNINIRLHIYLYVYTHTYTHTHVQRERATDSKTLPENDLG